MKRFITSILTTLLVSIVVFGQYPDATLRWQSSVARTEDGRYVVTLKGVTEPVSGDVSVHGTLEWITCEGNHCHSPEEYEFALDASMAETAVIETAVPKTAGSELPARAASLPSGIAVQETAGTPEPAAISADGTATSSGASKGLLALILEAVLWGFAMLLTPCVFPMVPMTVSFFIKGSEDKAQGRFRAMMYGLFIVLLYTVPICLIIGITWLAGGSAVTADIFNWLSTHWLPNILFFIVFMIFAASFFGAFELRMPSSLVDRADRNSDRNGLAGVFFMALTLVLVSFSCTGPIVGTVLIKSTSGEFWAPMVTMLAFSAAFALPFTVLALFPSLLKNLPKSGGWLNSVKVTLGFIEVALGFKFLSVADQTYHWGILDREVYLAIWIVCFTLLGFYLLGRIRFKGDERLEYISVKRLALVIADFAFVVYMIPGMWGAPLKALSGYLPPLETQDFVMGAETSVREADAPLAAGDGLLALPHGLTGYDRLEPALHEAEETGRMVFVDITGHGCVNCREMEARVWSDPRVLDILGGDFVIAALYVDDKTRLPESEWVVTEEGRTLKDVGRVNSYIALKRFGVNAQPNYLILSPDGAVVAGPRGYDLDVDGFVAFLKTR